MIGSGPSGLAATDLLHKMGHEVTVIERMDRPGGLLMYGIPNMKLPKEVIYRRIYLMREEGVHFLLNTEADPRVYETTIKRIITDEQDRITAVETVRLRRGADGRFEQIPGTEQTLPCELLLIAAGFTGCERETAERFEVLLDRRGSMMPPDRSHHLKDNIFSAGDMRTGQSLVVRALADGRAAALEVDSWLKDH